MTTYWNKRLSRRRALATTGAGALGAAFLAACGGDDSDEDPDGGQSQNGVLAEPRDTSGQAKAGGVLKDFVTGDTTTSDPIQSTSFSAKLFVAAYAYPQLVKAKAVRHPAVYDGGVEGDAAENFEFSPDKLQVTFKLRQGMAWDSRAPTNGRLIDAQDVVSSLNRYKAINAFAFDIFYDPQKAPLAPIESISSPDNRTVILKLKFPDASLLSNLSHYAAHYVLPRESEISGQGGFDPKGEVRGYGPWLLESYQPSVGWVWRKNPDYYVKDRPLPDRWERPIIGEYATRLAQFKAGNIYTTVVTQEDVFSTKRDVPATYVRSAENFTPGGSSLGFGYGTNGDSPWKDQRLRQAINYLMDRAALADVLGNRAALRQEGADVEFRFNSIVSGAYEGYWVDPTDEKKFGPNAKYFTHNIAEAKKLMVAAGFPDGVESTLYHNRDSNYPPVYRQIAEILVGMYNDGGMKIKQEPTDYQNDWLPNYHFGYTSAYHGGADRTKSFSGLALRLPTPYATPAQVLLTNQHKSGTRFEGCSPNGLNPQEGDPDLNAKIEKLKSEFDEKEGQKIALEISQFVAEKAYFIQAQAYTSKPLEVRWPVIQNVGVYRALAGINRQVTENQLQWWIDPTKAPLGSS